MNEYSFDGFDSLRKHIDEAAQKLDKVDPENSKSRLEWVLKDNPDIDSFRIRSPPELHDIGYKLGKMRYKLALQSAGVSLAPG